MFKKPIDRDIKGVIKVGQKEEENIKQELEEYVVTNELQKHFRDFFSAYGKGISGNTDRLPFHPYFVFKDLVTIVLFLVILSVFVFFYPNALGHSDNYIPANPMQTPPAIVPE